MVGRLIFYRVWGGVFFIMSLCACTGKLDRNEYIYWVQDRENGLHVTQEKNEIVFDLQFTPTEYIWLQRNKTEENPAKLEKDKKDIENTQYYTLTLEVNNKSDFIDYGVRSFQEKQQKIYYFSYLFQEDIKLEEKGEYLSCVLFHFERPVDLKNSRTFLLGFENPFKDSKEAKLIITSPQFGSLPIHIKISKDNIPALTI